MYCLSRPRLPLRLQSLEHRVAPAIITQAGQSFTDTEVLVGIRSDDPLFHLTGRVVTNRWNDIDIAGSSLMFRRESTGTGILEARLQPGVDPIPVIEKLRGQPGIEFAELSPRPKSCPLYWLNEVGEVASS